MTVRRLGGAAGRAVVSLASAFSRGRLAARATLILAVDTQRSKSDALALTISPYGYIEWRGPRAALEAQGLIPDDLNWPKRIDYALSHADGFDFFLRRCRPDGLNGPMRHWMKYDFWFVRRQMPRLFGDGWRVHEHYRERVDLLFDAIRSGEALSINCSGVHADKRIERLRARIIPQPMKVRR